MNELSYQFTTLAVTETKIVGDKPLDFNPDIPGYNFEYVSTPLSAGGVGLYILENLKYSVLEKTSNVYYHLKILLTIDKVLFVEFFIDNIINL